MGSCYNAVELLQPGIIGILIVRTVFLLLATFAINRGQGQYSFSRFF